MIYRIIKNGDKVLVTRSYKHAAKEYDHQVYIGQKSDILRLEVKKDGSDEWELARKDWL